MKFARISTRLTVNALFVYILFHVQIAVCADWSGGYEEKNGFSEFSPPSIISNYDHHYRYDHKKHKDNWRSGSSLNEFNVKNYIQSHNAKYHEGGAYDYKQFAKQNNHHSPNIRINPWKLVKPGIARQSFKSTRPWGKLPERKPASRNNMRLHDQRFKHWVNKIDDRYKPYLPGQGAAMYYNHYQYPATALSGVPSPGIHRNAYEELIMSQPLIDPLTHYSHRPQGGFVPFVSNYPGYFLPGNTYYPLSRYTYPQLSHVISGW